MLVTRMFGKLMICFGTRQGGSANNRVSVLNIPKIHASKKSSH